MTDQQFIQLTAECIRGDHGTAARLSAGCGYVYSAMLGTVVPPFRRFVDDVDTEIEDQQRGEVMDLLTLPLGKNRR